MTCTSCGDKPKGSSKGFPKAVVEINNPESLVLLRKVVIPVSMGTEEDVPPAIGKYFNVLLQYEANGHIYLYSSDGIPTAIEANIPQEVLDRIDQLEIDVDLLETGLTNETTAREAADSALSSSIESLSSSLSAETAAREQADAALEGDINNLTADLEEEATARETADTALGGRIDTVADNLATETANRISADEDLQADIAAEATARQTADAGLQNQIDAITAGSDVKDIVGTKAELNNYDTSTLGNNDIIKVLQDESENNATTYYRWNATTQQFTLIGEEGPYYTKSQADTLLNAKQNTLTAGSNVQIVNDTISATDTTYTAGTGLALNGTQFSVDTATVATQSDLATGLASKQNTLTAGSNVQINNDVISATDTTYTAGTGLDLTGTTFSADTTVLATQTDLASKQDTLTAGSNIQITNNTISATDTTYSDFTGTDGTTAGTAGLVPAPATTDAGKFLKADGTWDTAGSAINVVQTTGTSTTDVMSQNATTSMVFADPRDRTQVQIGHNAAARTGFSMAIGRNASVANGAYAGNAIGDGANLTSSASYSIALGTNSKATMQGELSVGGAPMSNTGYNNSNYRLITNVYDGQNDHDAVTVGQLNTAIAGVAGAEEINSTDWSALWQ